MKRVSVSMEFLFRASPTIVYKFLTTPDCLIRWFCDDCNLVDDYYTFEWEGEEEVALVPIHGGSAGRMGRSGRQ